MRSIVVLILLAPLMSMAFEPPSAEVRRAAVGNLEVAPRAQKRAFAPDSASFEPISPPGPSDWLTAHEEPGQTFMQFAASNPNRPTRDRHTIYLLPLGEFSAEHRPLIAPLRDFAAAFFAMDVKVLPPLPISAQLTTRRNPHTHQLQILTGDVLNLLKSRLPADAFCIVAITMEDLYPQPSWNFVFGQASLRERVGVYSFARYDPAFYGQTRAEDYLTLVLRRSCKVLVHETGHIFGLPHCIYYNCVMNGSNHLQESDSRPLHLCPVCLRKLQWSVGFDVIQRYNALEKVSRAAGLSDEADWLDHEIKTLHE